MAKKIAGSTTAVKTASKENKYPWLRLLDMDVQKTASPMPRGKGRPRNPFPRKSIHLTLTDDELAALDELVTLLEKQMGSGIHRGNMVAFLVFHARELLLKDGKPEIPDTIQTFTELADYIDQQ